MSYSFDYVLDFKPKKQEIEVIEEIEEILERIADSPEEIAKKMKSD